MERAKIKIKSVSPNPTYPQKIALPKLLYCPFLPRFFLNFQNNIFLFFDYAFYNILCISGENIFPTYLPTQSQEIELGKASSSA